MTLCHLSFYIILCQPILISNSLDTDILLGQNPILMHKMQFYTAWQDP